ncbi:MAG TPA: nickel-responsive transcriptional regulator NikR [Lentisphaerae bacterium]|nr:MAG: nickel-responsive transcriptional regulator NikR [Verrucomicrobiota bacterium]HDL77791.1 nickel-responsive transcriptional regulator NikR [Lentisphaerota bacterium]
MTERFSVSLEPDLLKEFAAFLRRHGYRNRSEAVRDLIRRALINDRWQAGGEVVGVLTLVYDHHQRDVQDRLTAIQHDNLGLIVSSTHVHLDHDNCLEVIILRGRASRVRKVSDSLISLPAVKDGNLVVTALTSG